MVVLRPPQSPGSRSIRIIGRSMPNKKSTIGHLSTTSIDGSLLSAGKRPPSCTAITKTSIHRTPHIFAYTRALGTEKYLIVINFSKTSIAYQIPVNLKAVNQILGNLGQGKAEGSTLHLEAWEARIYAL